MGFPLFSPLFALTVILLPFLPCHSAISIVVLFDPCLLVLFLGLLHVLLSIGYNDPVWSLDLYSCYCGLSWPITLLMGSFNPFLSPLAHFFLLGHPQPICFPWASSAHFLILHSHGLLLTLFSFPDPITVSFILGAHGLSINPLLSYFVTLVLLWPILTFLHHIMPMSLLLLSLGSFRPICFPQCPFIYFMGL